MQQQQSEVICSGLRFPEGPAFSSDGSLWAVELKGESLIRYRDGIIERFYVGGMPNGIAIDLNDQVWFCDAGKNAIRVFEPLLGISRTIATHVDGEGLNKPNDLAFDHLGNLIFTCPGNSRQEPTGYVCVLKVDGTLKKVSKDKYFPNGVAFTADGQHLILAETYKHRLWKGVWNAVKCELTQMQVWCDIGGPEGPGGPDGMAFNVNGDLYVAVYGTGTVRVVEQAGNVIKQIRLLGLNPTNCAFDKIGSLGFVITEAERGEIISLSSGY